MTYWHDTMVEQPDTDATVTRPVGLSPVWPCSRPSLRSGCLGFSRVDGEVTAGTISALPGCRRVVSQIRQTPRRP